jgi:hypothetical protein
MTAARPDGMVSVVLGLVAQGIVIRAHRQGSIEPHQTVDGTLDQLGQVAVAFGLVVKLIKGVFERSPKRLDGTLG